jgi:hypothetical protein
MNRKEMELELQRHDNTLLGGGFKDRGPWGDSRWRGNASGWVTAFLLHKYKVQKLAEIFAGSGTGSDVCRDWGIPYFGMDLNPNPVRDNIIAFNALTDDVPDEVRDSDMLFAHPPYSSLIKIPYADSQWKDTTADHNLAKYDLGRMDWDLFVKAMNKVMMKFYAAMPNGGRTAWLVGDIRRNGKCYSMFKDMVLPGTLEQVIIKPQWNTVSDGRTYSNKNFVPIVHEILVVLKKDDGMMIHYSLPVEYELDIRDSKTATWLDVVTAVMDKLGEADLDKIYSEIEGHEKAKANPHWKEKVRQTLQMSKRCQNKTRGVWAVAA